MRLKKVVIHGFKSFADRTVVEFAEGITAIVGPNGCGKSNISDAFRWVLGEQSAKSIRGNKMHDVIFAGTATRKPLNVAEVSLTLTDIQGTLPVDYEEVCITRRLHRSGESEYLLNGNPVRLKDIQGLFLDSGIGKNSFSIFEQGKIDEVINLSPMDRRTIFEEAAGILRFLQRKRETLRKLKSTDENITRIQDIHQEVEKQIEVLEKQVEAAKRFKENKLELLNLERAVAVAKFEQALDKRETLQTKREESQNKLNERKQIAGDLEKNLNTARADLDDYEEEFRSRSEELYQRRNDQALKAKEKQTNEERLQEAGKRWERLQTELKEVHEQRKKGREEYRSHEKGRKRVEERYALADKTVSGSRDEVRRIETAVTELRDRQQKAQQDRIRALQEESQINAEVQQLSVRVETAEEKLSSLDAQKQEIGKQVTSLQEGLDEHEAEVAQCSEAVDKQKLKRDALTTELERIEADVKTRQGEQESIVRKAAEVQARYQALQRLQEEMEGFSAGTKHLLQEAAESGSPLHGKIRGIHEVVRPKRGSELLVSTVMRPYAQTLVVEKRSDLQAVLAFAEDEKLQDFSLVCVEDCEASPKSRSDLKSLVEHVSGGELAQQLLGEVYRATDVSEALKLARESGIEVLTDDATYIDRHQVLFQASQSESNVFLREAEIQNLTESLEKLLVRQEGNEKAIEDLFQRRMAIEAERATIEKAVRSGEMRLVEVNFALQRAKSDLEAAARKEKEILTGKAALEEELNKLKTRIKEQQARYESLKQTVEKLANVLASGEGELEKQESVLREKRDDLLRKEEEYRQASEERQKLLHMLNLLEVQDAESEKQEQRLAREIESLTQMQQKAKGQNKDYGEQLKSAGKEVAESEAIYKETERSLKKKKVEIEQLAGRLKTEQERIHKSEEEVHQLGVKIAQVDSTMETVVNDLQERHQLSIPEAKELELSLHENLEESEKRIRSLRREQEKAGDVNMTSIDEFEKHKARHDVLMGQIGDMEGSKDELLAIIKELDTRSRKIFKEVFALVRANFQKNFRILFRGGEADLTFTESDDILEAGIEIVAKPPGKQMRSISLLSGGEKCLTAMALLFAIFEVKSAPFCILDEIDAPLDDSNITRFVNVVKQFIDRSQFIIITHNKRTMAIADRIFGVSMEERGVSKLLSMEFMHEDVEEEQVEDVVVSQV